ncbi:bifunctional phosphoribosylaminoimidazolecarboxamide formyltransferase/IMP cyclohydrolase [Pirellulaceae bacterium SH449]
MAHSNTTYEQPDLCPIYRAIISVSDKSGLDVFARELVAAGVELYSTGGTRKYLTEIGLEAKDVAEYTGFPEVMDGRVKTLHPKIFGGILARRTVPADLDSMESHGIKPFDLVVVNLYPFAATIAREGVTCSEAIEQIDIGGPSLIRAAAKNHAFTAVATRPEQYSLIIEQLKSSGGTSMKLRRQLAAECFAATSRYDETIAAYLSAQLESATVYESSDAFPSSINIPMQLVTPLRYGENPHQSAALYRLPGKQPGTLVDAKQLNGKELSFNNLLDLDAALNMVRCFAKPSCVVIKHNNPCGAASAHKGSYACRKALEGDPLSAFGGVLGFNCTVDEEAAEVLSEPGLFVEAIVAPAFTDGALEILKSRPKWRENVRLMATGDFGPQLYERNYKLIGGGALVQVADNQPPTNLLWKTVTEVAVADELWDDIAFGWEMVRHVKSNAIVLARDAALVGVGAGQMSRVDSVEISIEKAGDRSQGSILASDAFFPFPDSIQRAAKAGVIAIIQPGGSKKDAEVIAACNEHRIPMIFTGQRHFRH